MVIFNSKLLVYQRVNQKIETETQMIEMTEKLRAMDASTPSHPIIFQYIPYSMPILYIYIYIHISLSHYHYYIPYHIPYYIPVPKDSPFGGQFLPTVTEKRSTAWWATMQRPPVPRHPCHHRRQTLPCAPGGEVTGVAGGWGVWLIWYASTWCRGDMVSTSLFGGFAVLSEINQRKCPLFSQFDGFYFWLALGNLMTFLRIWPSEKLGILSSTWMNLMISRCDVTGIDMGSFPQTDEWLQVFSG